MDIAPDASQTGGRERRAGDWGGGSTATLDGMDRRPFVLAVRQIETKTKQRLDQIIAFEKKVAAGTILNLHIGTCGHQLWSENDA